MKSDWEIFVRARLNDLHPIVFNPQTAKQHDSKTVAVSTLAFKFYHQALNQLGFGRDYDGLPQLQLPII